MLSAPLIAQTAVQAAVQTRPNFVVLLADDLGWGDLACYGHPHIQTPSIDALAEQGVLFTQAYMCSGVCSPSRAAILTGHFPARHGIHGALGSQQKNRSFGMPDHLDTTVITLPDLLKDAGYATAHFGKWHLGGSKEAPLPSQYGFDAFWSIAHDKNEETDVVSYFTNDNGAGWRGTPEDFNAHSSEQMVDRAVRFIDDHRREPFYVQVWLQDVHARLRPTLEQMKPYAQRFRGAQLIYYSAVTNMDRQVGRLIDAIGEMGIAANTVVIFASDNGPDDIAVKESAEHGVGSPGPFRGRKRSLYEGGVRVPLIIRWPAAAPARQINNETVISGVDFLPTLCALAGVKLPTDLNPDGENMGAALRGTDVRRTKPLFWEYRFRIPGHVFNLSPLLAIRDGPYKLLMNPDRSRVELYNIPADPGELNNLAERRPEVVEHLSKQLADWRATIPDGPMHPGVGSNAYPWPK